MNDTPTQSSDQTAKPYGPFKIAATLTIFTTVTAVLLAVGNIITKPQIKLRLAEDLKAILAQVVPSNLHDNALNKDILSLIGPSGKTIKVYRAESKGKVIAIALPLTGVGYGGNINLVMGVNDKNEILGVRVLSHMETPGLGDRIEIKKSKWVLEFNGRSFENLAPAKWKVKKDGGVFDQFSGATITPRAVVKAVKRGLKYVRANHAKLFAGDANND